MNKTLTVGAPAPQFKTPDQNGDIISLDSFKGKWLVIYFYPKDNTPGCSIEAVDFTALKKDFDAEGAVVLGVSADSVASHQRFCQKKSLSITLLSDESHEMLKSYGAWQPKKLWGKEFLGIVRSTALVTPDGKIAHTWPIVKAKNHANEVLSKLKELK